MTPNRSRFPALRGPVPEPPRRKTDFEPHRGWAPTAAIALGVGVLDWITKLWVASIVPLGDIRVLVEGRVALWHVRNSALVLGLFGDRSLTNRMIIALLLGLAGIILLFEVLNRAHRLLPHRRPWAWLFVGLLCGGMLGNLGERALHWWVTDYLSFRWGDLWLPPGNVADLAIITSIPLALVVIAFEIEARRGRVAQVEERRPPPP